MKLNRRIVVVSFPVVVVLFALVVWAGSVAIEAADPVSKTSLGGGYGVRAYSPTTLASNSDVVVRAVPMSSESWLRPCCSRFDGRLPEGASPSVRQMNTVEFEVGSYLKGSGPGTVTVHVTRRGGNVGIGGDSILDLLEFETGREYVLFLVAAPDVTSWAEDGYILQGLEQGRWVVDGNEAARTTFEGRAELNLPIADLRDVVVDAPIIFR